MASEDWAFVYTDNPYINALVWGDRWNLVSEPITYSFRTGHWSMTTVHYSGKGEAWSAIEIAAVEKALATWSNVCNISFDRTATGPTNDIGFYLDSGIGKDDFAGISDTPSSPNDEVNTTIFNDGMEGWTSSSLQRGGYAFELLLHEIGHAIGLAHPHDHGGSSSKFPGVSGPYDTGDYNLNQNLYTVMSYVSYATGTRHLHDYNYGNVAGPMAFDIATVQAIYGANMNYKTGNDTYVLPSQNGGGAYYWCIWDAGGLDTISAAGSKKAAVIDLREAPLFGPHAGGYLSNVDGVYGGCTIANGAVIENAKGGTAADRITGNDANNKLVGGDGNDTIRGGLGDDTLHGGGGADKLYGGLGNDIYIVDNLKDRFFENASTGIGDEIRAPWNLNLLTMYGGAFEHATLLGSKATSITGNTADNQLTGNALNNTLTGGIGDDVLNGGKGSDNLRGGEGNDIYVVDRLTDKVDEQGAASTDDEVWATFSIGLGTFANGVIEHATLLGAAAINATGDEGNNHLTGNSATNILIGNDGDDELDGGKGDDSLFGGGGNDLYVVDSLSDVIDEQLNDDTGDEIKATISIDLSTVGAGKIEHATLLGMSDLSLIGTGGGNNLSGNSGSNSISGQSGNDELTGGGGDDLLQGGTGKDLLGGGMGNDTLAGDDDDDTLDGGEGNDILNGGVDNDVLVGGDGDDDLFGGDGNDLVEGGDGWDTVNGGSGNDELIVDDDFNMDIAYGGDGDDKITGKFSDALYGDDGNDILIGDTCQLFGGFGNDQLFGNGGSLKGGEGDDQLTAGANGGDLIGGAGNDILMEQAVSGSIGMYGDDGDDVLITDISSFGLFTTIFGGSGFDTLQLSGSDQHIDLPAISDSDLRSIEQIDLTGAGNNKLTVTAADVIAHSSTGQFTVNGNAGDALALTDDFVLSGTETVGAETYNVYIAGASKVLADQALTIETWSM